MKRWAKAIAGVAAVLAAAVVVGTGACSTGLGPSVLPPILTEKVPDATSIGSEACADCHTPEPDFYRHGRHQVAFFQGTRNAGCESCHGNGSVHAEFFYENDEYEDDPHDLVGIDDLGDLDEAERSALCQQCHQQDFPLWRISDHSRSQVGCWDCHSNDLHAPPPGVAKISAKMDQQSDEKFCNQCHPAVQAEFKLQFHHRVPEGQMKCSDCHSIHGEAPANASLQGQNTACYGCHVDIAGPFVFEHLGTEEGCENCHTPHGSVNDKLLVANDNTLCVQCHFQTPTTFFGRQPHSDFLSGGALCYDCHTHVHGSNTDRNLNPRRF